MSKDLFPLLAGNRRIKNELRQAVEKDPPSVSHAYIIAGPKGSGRHTLARSIAASLVCEKRNDPLSALPCGKCLACRKLFGGISPDLSYIEKDEGKSSTGVDTVRDLRRDIHIFPSELDYKFYIITEADTMTVQAQNAFLLTLEEPPAYAVIFLLCENTAALLETVRSRAQTLRTEPLSDDENREVLLRIFPGAALKQRSDPAAFEAAIMSSRGCPGRAAELLTSEEGAEIARRRATAVKFLEFAADRRSGAEALGVLIPAVKNSRDECTALLHETELAVRDLVLLKKDENVKLLFFADRQTAEKLCESFPIKRLLALYSAISAALNENERNLNVRLTLMNLLSDAGII